jgi:quinol monooxygenase YgiN
MMFGTVARMKVKPGKLDQLKALMDEEEQRTPDGYMSSTVYQSTDDPNVFWLCVVFRDRASYIANAESPGQDELYQRMRAILDADPEWHDGEVVYATSGMEATA